MNREAQLARTRAAIARGRSAESAADTRDSRTIRALLDQRETGVCVDCGRSHDAANRQRLIVPMLGLEPVDIAREWSCFYGPVIDYRHWKPTAGARLLFRDLKALRDSTRSTRGNAHG